MSKDDPQNGVTPNDAERIDASLQSKASKIFALSKLSKWFEIDLTIKVFGQVIWHYKWPPQE